MERLNAYCILEVLKRLSLKDQISTLQVNDYFHDAIRSIWMIKYKRQSINFVERDLTDAEYNIFFNVIKDFAEVMELRLMDRHKYELLKSRTYPHVTNLRLSTHPVYLEDEDILVLYRIFPNLRVFSPHGNLSGRYICLWNNMKELNLSYCYKLDLDQFHFIMGRHQLEHLVLNIFPINQDYEQLQIQPTHVQHLKYLRVNCYELYYFLMHPLPSLKYLIVTNPFNPRQLFDVLLSSWQAQDIRKVQTVNVESVLGNCLMNKMNVEEIFIISDKNVLPINVIDALDILTDLRTLRLRNCKLYTVNIMELLKHIPQVDVISLEECRMQEHHVELNVLEIVEGRNKLLRLNFFENQPRFLRGPGNVECIGPTHIDVTLLGSHEYFQLTKMRGSELSYDDPLYVEFR